jgi:spore germination protein YaaH
VASSGGCQKIAFGIPFYGYAWRLENSRVNNGLFASVDGTANGLALGVFINSTYGRTSQPQPHSMRPML